MVVGAAGTGTAGVVYVFERGPDGWDLAEEITAPALPPGARLGVALALDGNALAVGAPGAGRVLVFRRQGDAWLPGQTLAPPHADDTTLGTGEFGAAIALRDRDLWVGAPLADRRAGAVLHFRRQGAAAAAAGNDSGWAAHRHDPRA